MVKIRYLDGRRFRRAVLAGIEWLHVQRDHLNRINVYPVPDADTGTNMSLTMASAAEGFRQSVGRNIHQASRGMAEQAILGSQGNSGAILAQFFQGLAEGLKGKFRITTRDFAAAVERGKQAAYAALARPREGTILTVIKDWCDAISARKDVSEDFVDLLRYGLNDAKASLARTPDQLPVLKEHGVVDAGAQGFINLLEGITEFVETGNVRRLSFSEDPADLERFAFAHPPISITFRYCTECILEAPNATRAEVEEVLAPLGDSIVIVKGERLLKLHLHTDDPERAFKAVAPFGAILKKKKEDMQVQHDEATADPASVAIVVDSACDLPERYVLENRVRVVPLRVVFGDESYLDRVELTADGFARKCLTSAHHPKTSQPAVGDYLKAFEAAAVGGKDILVVSLSGAVSGTLNAAKAAAAQFKGAMVYVVDSHKVSVAQGLLVEVAREMALAGERPERIAARLEELTRQLTFFIALRSLEFARRGGRVSHTASTIARVLNLKPVLYFDEEGKAAKAGVAFGAQGRSHESARAGPKGVVALQVLQGGGGPFEGPELGAYYRDRVRDLTGLPTSPSWRSPRSSPPTPGQAPPASPCSGWTSGT